jgi:hypothetical protein
VVVASIICVCNCAYFGGSPARDVKITFLNRELEEEIYMTQSDGFIVKSQEDKVCKVQKSLYDLK